LQSNDEVNQWPLRPWFRRPISRRRDKPSDGWLSGPRFGQVPSDVWLLGGRLGPAPQAAL